MPMKHRWLTCCLVRNEGQNILIDCGEGTQIALKCAGRSVQKLDLLCFTHYHADHISGLPGLLLSMGLEGRTEPLTLCGPVGLQRTVEGLRVIAPELPFALKFIEFHEKVQQLHFAGLEITAFSVHHTMPCYGYRIHLPRVGKFDAERAKAAQIPMRVWGMLQKQEMVEYEGKCYYQSQVLGPSRKGISMTYCTDTRPVPAIAEYAKDADLLILEGMYGDPEKMEKALETRHMMYAEAAEIAKKANAGRLWLTHYSPSMPDPNGFLHYAKDIFPDTICPRDGQSIDLQYTDES